jgi:hypothetical protein
MASKPSKTSMTFAELMERTVLAQPGTPVRVRLADGTVAEVADVEVPLVDLDEGKLLGDTAEGQSRHELVVWLLLDT